MDIEKFWDVVLEQDADAIRTFFAPDAYVNWHNTNEHFSVEEFIRANCEYPGDWLGEIEKEIHADNMVITVTHVHNKDGLSFHVSSFVQVKNDKIVAIDEHWGDDGEAPQWRQDLNIGSKIK